MEQEPIQLEQLVLGWHWPATTRLRSRTENRATLLRSGTSNCQAVCSNSVCVVFGQPITRQSRSPLVLVRFSIALHQCCWCWWWWLDQLCSFLFAWQVFLVLVGVLRGTLTKLSNPIPSLSPMWPQNLSIPSCMPYMELVLKRSAQRTEKESFHPWKKREGMSPQCIPLGSVLMLPSCTCV